MIICAHGAVMSNMFFCKEGTTIIEVTCDTNWVFFNEISKILNLNHIKCGKNNFDEIIKCIKINEL
jgi:capsular polysaccharide biosynthesis protein